MGLGEFHSPAFSPDESPLAWQWYEPRACFLPLLLWWEGEIRFRQLKEKERRRRGVGEEGGQYGPAPAYLFILGKTGVASKTQISQSVKHQQSENSRGSVQFRSAKLGKARQGKAGGPYWEGRLFHSPSSLTCTQTNSAPCDFKAVCFQALPIPPFWILSIIFLWLLQQSGGIDVN